jgi:nicotinamide phosphoribosyltransferase
MYTYPPKNRRNIILLTDSYKVSHYKQYPKGTTNVYSYFESRGGMFKETVFFGLQYIIQEYLNNPVTWEDIEEASDLYAAHFGDPLLFNRKGWEHIVRVHEGRLPVKIKAVPEGMHVRNHNVLMTLENTDPAVPWLTNFLETLLVQVWYPTTVCTLSNQSRQTILKWLEKTGDPSLIDFKLHDFGFRCVSSVESAGIGGAAHLVNFLGTDTVRGITTLRDYYGAKQMTGFSIPASEHSTITSWGREGEVDAFANMIEQYGDGALYACVSDSFDIFNACSNLWGGVLRDKVLNANGTLVVRPDSGYPPIIVTQVLNALGEKFGATVNEKGYKVLNPKVRVIQGDGMDFNMIDQALSTMAQAGWSADNVAFGMGGGLLQKVDRDTQKFAFKCSSVTIDGKDRDVFKDPVTDSGKVSKKGRLGLRYDARHGVATVHEKDNEILDIVWVNGEFNRVQTIDQIRELARM